MVPYGTLWNLYELYGTFLDLFGTLRHLTALYEIYGTLWTFMEIFELYGTLWNFMALYVTFWYFCEL